MYFSVFGVGVKLLSNTESSFNSNKIIVWLPQIPLFCPRSVQDCAQVWIWSDRVSSSYQRVRLMRRRYTFRLHALRASLWQEHFGVLGQMMDLIPSFFLGGFSRAPTKLRAIDPHGMHDNGQLASQGDLGSLVPSMLPDLERPDLE